MRAADYFTCWVSTGTPLSHEYNWRKWLEMWWRSHLACKTNKRSQKWKALSATCRQVNLRRPIQEQKSAGWCLKSRRHQGETNSNCKRVHPRRLRHTLAYELAAEKTPISLIPAQHGNGSSSTTNWYLNRLNLIAVVEAMKARTWSLYYTHNLLHFAEDVRWLTAPAKWLTDVE
jgi:hypothetical protein